MSEREELAKQMAFASRHPNDTSRDADEFWDFTSAGSRDDWLRSAGALLAAGYRRIPAEGTPEWEAMVERVARKRFKNNVREAIARDPDEHRHEWGEISEAAREGWRWQVRGVLAALTQETGEPPCS